MNSVRPDVYGRGDPKPAAAVGSTASRRRSARRDGCRSRPGSAWDRERARLRALVRMRTRERARSRTAERSDSPRIRRGGLPRAGPTKTRSRSSSRAVATQFPADATRMSRSLSAVDLTMRCSPAQRQQESLRRAIPDRISARSVSRSVSPGISPSETGDDPVPPIGGRVGAWGRMGTCYCFRRLRMVTAEQSWTAAISLQVRALRQPAMISSRAQQRRGVLPFCGPPFSLGQSFLRWNNA